MSGQTYTTQIRIPTPQELAAQVAQAARNQGVASAQGVEGSESLAMTEQLRADALRFVVDTIAPIAQPITGTASTRGPGAAQVELSISGARVPVQIEVDAAEPQVGRLRLDFSNAHGLTCADEDRIAGAVTSLFAKVSNTPDPSAGAVLPTPARSVQR